ncbi:MAG: fibronectin type III domain-containing protein [Pseudomonadota bacterium]
MNINLRAVIPIAVTIFTFAILFDSTAYAAVDRKPITPTSPSVEEPVEEPVNLSWTAPTTRTDGETLTLSELEGYRIYYGTESDDLIPLVDLNDSSITSYSITDLRPGIYYFAVTAYDYEGLESGFSEIASKEIL